MLPGNPSNRPRAPESRRLRCPAFRRATGAPGCQPARTESSATSPHVANGRSQPGRVLGEFLHFAPKPIEHARLAAIDPIDRPVELPSHVGGGPVLLPDHFESAPG